MTPKIMFIKPTTKTVRTHTYTSTYVDIQKGNVEKKSFIWINRLFRFGKMKKDNNKQRQQR